MAPAVKVNVMNRHFPHRAGSRVGDEPTTAPGRFAAFGNRNFRLYFVGQTISSIGSWAQSLAVTWLVLDLTDRSDQLGIALALQFLPMLILGAPAGVLADRLNNRRLLLATSAASGVLALTFGIVVSTGHATIWWIYALTFALGLVLAVERPTMQAILFQLVGRDLLSNAVAANGTINSVSRLIGPAIAGGLIATVGVTVGFYINAASYLVVIAALLALRASELVARPMIGQTKGKLREGFAYVRSHPEVARPLVVMSIVSIVGRKLASAPVPGDLELMQMGSAVGAAAFFAYCHMTRNDVKVDFFTQNWNPRVVALLDALGSLLVALFGVLFTWRTWVGAMTLKEYGETSAILGWPVWVAQVLMVPGFFLMAAAGFYMCFHFLTREGKGATKGVA